MGSRVFCRSISYLKPKTERTRVETWKNASILSRVFPDKIVHNADIPDYSSQSTAYVTPSTEYAANQQQIKGINGIFLERAFTTKIIYATPVVHRCDLFTAYYFPPWHFVSAGRKSRPSIVCQYSMGQHQNGESSAKGQLEPNSFSRSKNPMDYAVWRKRIKLSLRSAFWNHFQAKHTSPDGTYLFRMNKVPTDQHMLEKQVSTVLREAAAIASSAPAALSWVDQAKKQAGIPAFNILLSRRAYRPVELIPRNKWLKSLFRDDKNVSQKT